jgi:hypothetical protein
MKKHFFSFFMNVAIATGALTPLYLIVNWILPGSVTMLAGYLNCIILGLVATGFELLKLNKRVNRLPD